MKALRRPSTLAAIGVASVAASLLGVTQAWAASVPVSTLDHEDDGDDECEGGNRVAGMVAGAVAREKAALKRLHNANVSESAAKRKAHQTIASGSTSQQKRANAAYRQARRVTARARQAEHITHAALNAARKAAAKAPACGATPTSPPVTPTPTPPPTPAPVPAGGLTTPAGVTSNSASALSNGAFRLSWSSVTGAATYEIARDGVVLGTTAYTTYVPASSVANSRHSYTVTAVNGTVRSTPSVAASAGRYVGDSIADKRGLSTYGQIQVSLAVTANRVTGCWATYPNGGTSGSINSVAIPTLCAEAISAQSATIAAVSGASATSPAFKTSLQSALTRAGI